MLMIDRKDQNEAEELLNGKKKDRFNKFVNKKGKLKRLILAKH